MPEALIDVNALIALAWDSHVHHAAMRTWFAGAANTGWATCPVTESGFVRVSSNAKILPAPISTGDARRVLAVLRALPGHRFVVNDVSLVDADVPAFAGHRQVTDGVLLTVARRHGLRVVTFDAGLASLAAGRDVELLRS